MGKADVNWSKVGKRAKRRGKTYERRCAKILIDHTKVNFRSTPASGGFNKQGGVTIREELFCGDLICDDPSFRYCIEAKNRENFSFTALLKSPETAAFTKWWYQCVEDAKLVNLEPLMFFKPNIRDDFIVISKEEWLSKYNDINCPYFELGCYRQPVSFSVEERVGRKKVKKKVTALLPEAVMIDWKQFVKHHNPKLMFKEL
jgi:hypothetical protein